jgi:hypothetical protein
MAANACSYVALSVMNRKPVIVDSIVNNRNIGRQNKLHWKVYLRRCYNKFSFFGKQLV